MRFFARRKQPMAQPRKVQTRELFLIDGSSFLYRAFYAMKPLHTRDGVAVHAVYGFARMLKKLIDTFSPEYMCIAWDSRGATVRHELLPSYKAQRQAIPQDLSHQKELIQELIDLVGIAQIAQVGIEADDLLYALAKKFSSTVKRVVIVTTDKDLAQLVDETVVLYDAFKEKVVDRAAVVEQFKLQPERLPVYFALIGDASDNIPGVAGIGPKTAQPLAERFSTIAELYRVVRNFC